MSVFLNKDRVLGVAVVGMLLISGLIYYVGTRGGRPPSLGPYYYTVDDGKTFFSSDILRIPPFSKDGEEAVAVALFKDNMGQAFVGFLYKYSTEGKQMLAQLPTDNAYRAEASRYCVVKRPGEGRWVPADSAAGRVIAARAKYFPVAGHEP